MHKNNFKGRHRRVESRLDETIRIASIVQKGMSSGRSSYVEMRTLERIVQHNIKSKIQLIKSGSPVEGDVAELLSRITTSVHGGYVDTITPNGVLRKNELDRLLSIDSEISMCLGMVESLGDSRAKSKELVHTLKELIEERKRLIGSLRA